MEEPLAIDYKNLLKFFPQAVLPYSITTETYKSLMTQRAPLPEEFVREFLVKEGEGAIDEFSEFMPVIQFSLSTKFSAVVYWQAGLHGHTYHVAAFSMLGTRISTLPICGTSYTEEGQIRHSVAVIRPDLSIFIKDGMTSEGDILNPEIGFLRHYRLTEQGEVLEDKME